MNAQTHLFTRLLCITTMSRNTSISATRVNRPSSTSSSSSSSSSSSDRHDTFAPIRQFTGLRQNVVETESPKDAAESPQKSSRSYKHVRWAQYDRTSFHHHSHKRKNAWFLGVAYLYSACYFRFRGGGSKNYFYEIPANPGRKLYLIFFPKYEVFKIKF